MHLSEHIIADTSPLLEALRRLNALSGSVMTLLAVDDAGRLSGTLTDGDVRRALLRGVPLEAPVADAMRPDCQALSADLPSLDVLRQCRRRGIRLIPLVDDRGRPVDALDSADTVSLLPLSAILMAGGRGERLRPLTLSTPKPLLHVGGRPIIDYNVALLRRYGITDISITVNYLAEQLEAYARECGVRAVREPRPLGTIGAAAYVPRGRYTDTLVMNSDLLTDINLEEMWLAHVAAHADITVATVPYKVAVPYAVLTLEGESVTGLEEKPVKTYQANAGIYIISNARLDTIARDTPTHATDLLERTILDGGRVTCFPISGRWVDIGSPHDYARACEMMQHSAPAAR